MDNPVPEKPIVPAPPTEQPVNPQPKAEPQTGFPQPVEMVPTTPPTPMAPASDHTSVLPGSEKPKSKTSVLMVVAIVLLLGAIGVLGFFIFRNIQNNQTPAEPTPTPIASPTPTPDPTADWQTFKDNLLTFLYPPGWVVSNSEGKSSMSGFHYYIDLKNSTYDYGPAVGTLSISYWDNPQMLDIPTFQKQVKGMPIYNTSYTAAQVGEAKGYYTKNGPCEPVACEAYSVIYKDKIFTILLFQPSIEQYRQTVDQILTTFKFIEATPSGSPTSSPSASPTTTP